MTRRPSAAAQAPPPPAPIFPTIPPADVLGRLAALQTLPTADLKRQWRELFGKEPPPFNRPYLQSRLAYRVQELAYGGLKPETRARLEALGEQLDGGNVVLRRVRADSRPLPGTRLVREYEGVQHVVTVLRRRLRVRGPALPVALRHRARTSPARAGTVGPSSACEPARWRMSRRRNAWPTPPMPAKVKKLRCAVYTRKSTDEGLEKEFNTLDAQRDACEAYVASQRAEGWVLVHDRYDDGGFSGGTLERPALDACSPTSSAGRWTSSGPYKMDRLTRSLTDFAKLVERFEAHGVTFVSVTQAFNTTTSMGRLTLNILLSFAQFEREVIGERIRDKVAASKARGMWMGGKVPLGYDVRDRKLVVNEAEAARVRRVFELFAETGSGVETVRRLRDEGVPASSGRPLNKGDVYKLLNNRTYVGEVAHKGKVYPASTRRSCRGNCGTARTPFCRRARGCAPTGTGRRRRRC